ncbi:hypothetical protein Ct9H90mP12_1810 [bacterium]|nr:MAG: hypothetical protein Ct9H90mP12_1810 [bacterium]
MRTLRLLFFISITISSISATWFDDIPRTITQPDGETFDCFVTGDQYGRRLHDRNDFTIILDPEDGYYYYADRGPDGDLVPTDMRVGLGDPRSIGLEPGYDISQEIYNRNKEFYGHGPTIQY